MYLIIALVIIAPIGARLYRRLTLNRTTQMLREQLHSSHSKPSVDDPAGATAMNLKDRQYPDESLDGGNGIVVLFAALACCESNATNRDAGESRPEAPPPAGYAGRRGEVQCANCAVCHGVRGAGAKGLRWSTRFTNRTIMPIWPSSARRKTVFEAPIGSSATCRRSKA